jgi:hypothetical protein
MTAIAATTDVLDSAARPTTAAHAPGTPGRAARWTGRVLGGLIIAFLTWDAVIKIMRHPMAVDGSVKVGYPAAVVPVLGVVLLAAVLLYAWPRTAALGAIVLTGYLGGAVATHVRIGDPLFSHALFPVYFGVILWLALWLRDSRLRAILPIHEANEHHR